MAFPLALQPALAGPSGPDEDGITFPLLTDFEPKGAVARAYGVYRPEDGVSERALFVLDGDGGVARRDFAASRPQANVGSAPDHRHHRPGRAYTVRRS